MPGAEQLAVLIPIIIFMIPIVAILTAHQRKMAEIVHGSNSNQNTNPQALAETTQMREEMRQLREMMNQQTLAIDNLRDEFRGRSNIEQRLSDQS
jgi:hypothetical protein